MNAIYFVLILEGFGVCFSLLLYLYFRRLHGRMGLEEPFVKSVKVRQLAVFNVLFLVSGAIAGVVEYVWGLKAMVILASL